MNEFLAELYGTREAIGADSGTDDVEKLAEAQILDQVFESDGIDVDQLDDGTILKVAHELFGDESALVKMAAEGCDCGEGESCEQCSEGGEEDEAEDKVAQADFLGRVMAHSFTQERDNIEKTGAGAKEIGQKVLGALQSAAKGEGITAVVMSDDCGGMHPHFQLSRGVKLMVSPEQTQRAREILGLAEDSAEEEE